MPDYYDDDEGYFVVDVEGSSAKGSLVTSADNRFSNDAIRTALAESDTELGDIKAITQFTRLGCTDKQDEYLCYLLKHKGNVRLALADSGCSIMDVKLWNSAISAGTEEGVMLAECMELVQQLIHSDVDSVLTVQALSGASRHLSIYYQRHHLLQETNKGDKGTELLDEVSKMLHRVLNKGNRNAIE